MFASAVATIQSGLNGLSDALLGLSSRKRKQRDGESTTITTTAITTTSSSSGSSSSSSSSSCCFGGGSRSVETSSGGEGGEGGEATLVGEFLAAAQQDSFSLQSETQSQSQSQSYSQSSQQQFLSQSSPCTSSVRSFVAVSRSGEEPEHENVTALYAGVLEHTNYRLPIARKRRVNPQEKTAIMERVKTDWQTNEQAWRQAQQDQEDFTKVRSVRTKYGGYEYFDVTTSEPVPPEEYQSRYEVFVQQSKTLLSGAAEAEPLSQPLDVEPTEDGIEEVGNKENATAWALHGQGKIRTPCNSPSSNCTGAASTNSPSTPRPQGLSPSRNSVQNASAETRVV